MLTIFKSNGPLVICEEIATTGDPALAIPIDSDNLLDFIGAMIRVYWEGDDTTATARFGAMQEGER